MQIKYVEIANFRKLRSVRIDMDEKVTLFVGANNSGKTSAMTALRLFLKSKNRFSTNDFTLSHWETINTIGKKWEGAVAKDPKDPFCKKDWATVVPAMDVWLYVENDELHYVSDVIPTLDWDGGLLGIRLRLEPKDFDKLFKEYVSERERVSKLLSENGSEKPLRLWPENMIDFLSRRITNHFTVAAYSLDPSALTDPEDGQAIPQLLSEESEPIDGNPFDGIMRIDEIAAQRGLGQDVGKAESGVQRDCWKLSEQLRSYYDSHLNPETRPEKEDLEAIGAIEQAQTVFDDRLRVSFEAALSELSELVGYPGITDPRIKISTRLRPMDGLDHDSAVQYEVEAPTEKSDSRGLHLPEAYNGLGYQNLISMTFNLMGFRDKWMRVGKAEKQYENTETPVIEPLHVVLVEEPEAHLHVQVQQVFINKAYEVLRKHADLGGSTRHRTQLLVSTHSSHVAHEIEFSSIRYFRRLQRGMNGATVPISTVSNLSRVFGDDNTTRNFVTRYLRAYHCDLFFADAAIFIEGSAERMLMPLFIRKNFSFLSHCYVSLLEIGGSHAHRMKDLIEALGLTTLIITDLDAGKKVTGKKGKPKAVLPKRGNGQVTNNATLSKWLPQKNDVDTLLDLEPNNKEKYNDELFSVRVAYQCPISVKLNDSAESEEALPYTFEDALVFSNLKFFENLDGNGFVGAAKSAIETNKTVPELGEALLEGLRKDGVKASFALDVINANDFDDLVVPKYIAEGLEWLEEKLGKNLEMPPKLITMAKDSINKGDAK